MSRKKAGEKSWESFPRPFSWQRAGGREEEHFGGEGGGGEGKRRYGDNGGGGGGRIGGGGDIDSLLLALLKSKASPAATLSGGAWCQSDTRSIPPTDYVVYIHQHL